MKIDRTKLKRSSSEVPADCKALIDKLKNCNQEQLLNELKQIKSWTCGKCELYHWVDLLDVFDDILGECCAKQHENQWTLPCDSPQMDPKKKELLMHIISFTALLIEHSFSRHLYSSMDHLITLLSSSDMQIVLSVLGLLFVFSKRSNFIGKLSIEKRQELLTRLSYLAESWGGKENGFGLAECCKDLPMSAYPSSATTLHFEYYTDHGSIKNQVPSQSTSTYTEPTAPTTNLCPAPQSYSQALRQPRRTASTNQQGNPSSCDYVADKKSISVIHIDNVDQIKGESIANIMERLVATYNVPRDKQMQLFTHLRLAHCFSDPVQRIQCVQARLQAMSIIIYCAPATTQEIGTQLLYNGFIEELVDILQLEGNDFIDIKSAALRTLTSVVHLDRNSRLSTIIDATETSSYHGFLPVLVRNCIQSLINDDNKFPIPYATALFSFLYHLASYEKGGEALVSCGMMESLLKIISWRGTELEHITFVTRSVRVIDLITNIDMTVFQSQSGLNIFVERLENEVKICRKELCDESDDVEMNQTMDETSSDSQQPMDVDSPKTPTNLGNSEMNNDESQSSSTSVQHAAPQHSRAQQNPSAPRDIQCYTQRAALLKSMLNFLKKAIQDSTFSDCIRHLMDGSLPKSLRHIISNASYYGSSLFLLSMELVSTYVFQEPALLSSLQESQLTKDILDAILDKPLPPTREILAALPNTFSALCLNNAGLQAFQARKPFEKIFRVLISPEYLPAMRRRKADLANDTATNLGNSMDELMRHQPSLRADVVSAIINLLKELCELGDNPTYTCCTKVSSKSNESATNPVNIDIRSIQQNNTINETAVFTDDEDEDDEDSASPPVGSNRDAPAAIKSPAKPPVAPQADSVKTPVPLIDYILNVMRFVDAILTNNSTDDHVREFLRQDGLVPLLRLMRLKNLPIDFPNTQACGGISSVCRSILALARDPKVVQEALRSLDGVLDELQVLHKPLESVGGSVLLEEYGQIASNTNISDPVVLSNLTPLLHSMSAAHAYVVMFSCINRSNHLETRNICINHWGKDRGLEVLKKMSRLYMALVWESTVLINITKPTIPQVNLKSAQPPSAPNENYGIAQLDRLPVISLPNENDSEDPQQQQQQQQSHQSNQSKIIATGQARDSASLVGATGENLRVAVGDTTNGSSTKRSKTEKSSRLIRKQKRQQQQEDLLKLNSGTVTQPLMTRLQSGGNLLRRKSSVGPSKAGGHRSKKKTTAHQNHGETLDRGPAPIEHKSSTTNLFEPLAPIDTSNCLNGTTSATSVTADLVRAQSAAADAPTSGGGGSAGGPGGSSAAVATAAAAAAAAAAASSQAPSVTEGNISAQIAAAAASALERQRRRGERISSILEPRYDKKQPGAEYPIFVSHDLNPILKDLAQLVRKHWKCNYIECSAASNWNIRPIISELTRALECNNRLSNSSSGISMSADDSERSQQTGRRSGGGELQYELASRGQHRSRRHRHNYHYRRHHLGPTNESGESDDVWSSDDDDYDDDDGDDDDDDDYDLYDSSISSSSDDTSSCDFISSDNSDDDDDDDDDDDEDQDNNGSSNEQDAASRTETGGASRGSILQRIRRREGTGGDTAAGATTTMTRCAIM
uniref:E3 ubiquitin-protein ligase HUWE1 n=1 Tax=Aceria tosichella TaxID=561515 RepID=A0A6G1SLG6_9ACAR